MPRRTRTQVDRAGSAARPEGRRHPRHGGKRDRHASGGLQPAVENVEIARLFRELADLLDIEGANPFRVRAYRTAARTVETEPRPLAVVALQQPEQLTELHGIGEDLAGKVVEIVRTGRLAALEEATHRIPPGLSGLLRLPGLGPRKVQALHGQLGVADEADLARAVASGKVKELRGFGSRTEARLRQALARSDRTDRRMPLPIATQYGEALHQWMRQAPGIGQVEIAGSYRRRKDTVGDLDVLVTARRATGPVIEHFLQYPERAEVLAHGDTRAAIRLRAGLQVDLRVLEPASYGAGMYYFTGSKAHNIAVRRLAQERGLKINEYGVWRGRRRVAGRTERSVVKAVGLPLIPPELREDRGELEAARAGRLPRLVALGQIRGDLQSHTTASDGRASLETMAEAAEALGYDYLAVTDHTRAVRVAGGLDREGFRHQRHAIDRWNAGGHRLTLLAGAEVDILPDGGLDLDDDTLAGLDLVVVSLHTRLDLPRQTQTRRVVRALRHRAVDILGHPTGRLLGRRPGADFDFEEIVRVATDRGVILEINAQPDRLDLDDLAVQAALRHGVRLAISTDAHAAAELGFMQWGVNQARRGWATPEAVVNTRSLPSLRALLHRQRHGGRSLSPIDRPQAHRVVRKRHTGRTG